MLQLNNNPALSVSDPTTVIAGQITDDHSVSGKVLQEQISLTCQQLAIMAVSSFGANLVMAHLFYGVVSTFALVLWISLSVILVGLIPLVMFFMARKQQGVFKNIQLWTRLIVGNSLLGGGAWGLSAVLLFSDNSVIHQLLLLMFLLAGSSLVMVMMAAYPPAFYAAVIPMLLPITLRFLASNSPLSSLFATMPIIYGVSLVYFYKNVHCTLLESLRLRFDLANAVVALAEQKNRAEAADQAKSKFLAAASHDLRQPLHAQGLFVEELQARNRDPVCSQLLLKLKLSMEAMHGLFNSLLDISKLDAHVIKPEWEIFSIKVLLREIYLDFSPLAAQKNIEFHVCHSDAIIKSDPTLLKRILRNLASNAIRYTNKGKVLIGCRRDKDRLHIQIWDTGIGINTADQHYVFEEFVQLHNHERDRHKGLGLGLAIVKRLTNVLDHSLVMKSQHGKGSMFCVTVPFIRRDVTELTPNLITVNKNNDLSGHTVIVIDDELDILVGMKSLLEQWGCRVFTAESTAQAIENLSSLADCPSAVIADYRLRNHETGADAITHLRAQFKRKIPGLLITGDTAPQRLQEAYSSGYHVLHKPVPPAKLRSLLGYIIQAPAVE